MCPDDFMGELIIDGFGFDEEEGVTCNDIDSYIKIDMVDCESEEEQGTITLFASMCCENMHMEPCNNYYLLSRSIRKLINDIFFSDGVLFFIDAVLHIYIKKSEIACILARITLATKNAFENVIDVFIAVAKKHFFFHEKVYS